MIAIPFHLRRFNSPQQQVGYIGLFGPLVLIRRSLPPASSFIFFRLVLDEKTQGGSSPLEFQSFTTAAKFFFAFAVELFSVDFYNSIARLHRCGAPHPRHVYHALGWVPFSMPGTRLDGHNQE